MERYVSDPAVAERRIVVVGVAAVAGVLATFLVAPQTLVFVGPTALALVGAFAIVMLKARENVVTLDLGAFGFAIRRKRTETYEWRNIEAAWQDADYLSFRANGHDHRLALRGFSPAVRERILGDFRAKTPFSSPGGGARTSLRAKSFDFTEGP